MARCQKFGRIVDRMKEIAIFERKLPKAKSIVVIIMYYTRTRIAKKNYGLVSMEKCAVSRAEYGGESAAVAPSAFFRRCGCSCITLYNSRIAATYGGGARNS